MKILWEILVGNYVGNLVGNYVGNSSIYKSSLCKSGLCNKIYLDLV